MGVDDEEDEIGLLDRHARLVLHPLLDVVPGSSSRPPVSTTVNVRPFHSEVP